MRKHVSDGFSTKAFTYNYLPWNPTNCWFPDFGWLWWFLGGLAIEFHQVLPVVPPAEFPSCHGKPCWFHAEVGWGIYQRPSIWLVFVPPHAFYLWSYLSKLSKVKCISYDSWSTLLISKCIAGCIPGCTKNIAKRVEKTMIPQKRFHKVSWRNTWAVLFFWVLVRGLTPCGK